MRYLKLFLVVVSLIIIAGCQNKELLQCRQEKQDVWEQLSESQEQNTTAEKSMSLLMERINESQKENKSLQTQADKLEAENAKLIKDRISLDKAIQQAQAEINKLEQKLASAHEKFKNATDMLLKLTEENNKGQARIAELEEALEQTQETSPEEIQK